MHSQSSKLVNWGRCAWRGLERLLRDRDSHDEGGFELFRLVISGKEEEVSIAKELLSGKWARNVELNRGPDECDDS